MEPVGRACGIFQYYGAVCPAAEQHARIDSLVESLKVVAVVTTPLPRLSKYFYGVTVTWIRTVRVTALPPMLSPVRA